MNDRQVKAIAWMTFVVAVVFAVISFQQNSFDGAARNVLLVEHAKMESIEQSSQALNREDSEAFAPLSQALQSAQGRDPSSLPFSETLAAPSQLRQ